MPKLASQIVAALAAVAAGSSGASADAATDAAAVTGGDATKVFADKFGLRVVSSEHGPSPALAALPPVGKVSSAELAKWAAAKKKVAGTAREMPHMTVVTRTSRTELAFTPRAFAKLEATAETRDHGHAADEPEAPTSPEPMLAHNAHGKGAKHTDDVALRKRPGRSKFVSLVEETAAARGPVGQDPAWEKVTKEVAHKYPASRVGRFSMPDSDCSGTFVSPHAVLTSGHCTYNVDRTKFYAKDGWFIPGTAAADDEPFGKFEVSTLVYASQYAKYRKAKAEDDAANIAKYEPWADFDIGVACTIESAKAKPGVLDISTPADMTPLDKETPERYANTDPDWTAKGVHVYSYPAELKSGREMWHDVTRTHRNGRQFQVGVHYGDTEKGSSGAGLLRKVTKDGKTKYEVAGVHTWDSDDANLYINPMEWTMRKFILGSIADCEAEAAERAKKATGGDE